MHELSLIQSLLTIIEAQAEKEKFTRVNQVALSCGRLSAVEPSALAFAFKTLAQFGICADAELKLTILPMKIHCFTCNREFIDEDADPTSCPHCRGDQVVVTEGWQELQLLELDVD
ncbi:MAG: hydrogenase maturation nickel metallochaperone HypA [Deltaproteobacteria bacterium]|nr:hydrogenase maturation nickel metallochaperone HypA [Deltaproteobacteria bacterium]